MFAGEPTFCVIRGLIELGCDPAKINREDLLEAVYNRSSNRASSKSYFKALVDSNSPIRIPTGNPQCPPHVRRAKRLRYRIEERSDASNMVDGNGSDLGFDNEEEENGEEGSNDAAAQAPEAGRLNRVLFDQGADQEGAQQNPRPLVRTPRGAPPGSN
jgi:hypothetical protein